MTTTPPIPTLPLGQQQIPQFGLGTYKLEPQLTVATVLDALELGIRHVDTAQMYRNEAEVGEALEKSQLPRDEVFITTKLNNSNHEPAKARESLLRSLDALRTDHVDLFLIHWPLPTRYGGDFVTTWRALLEFQAEGYCTNVGVSNFQIAHLERLERETGVLPLINQVEAHPYFANRELLAWHHEKGILTEAWSPLARGGELLNEPQLVSEAAKYGKTPAQLVLRWALERDCIIFPKSSHAARIRENMQLFDFSLEAETTRLLDLLDRGEAGRTGSHPDKMDWIPDF